MAAPEPPKEKKGNRLKYWYLIVFVAFALFILIDYLL